METCKTETNASASILRAAKIDSETLHATGVYNIECFDSSGKLKWKEVSYNVVPNQGKNGMLDTYFAGSAYTASWYMSLITAGTAISTSTYATPTVTEITSGIITGDLRVAVTWSGASAGSKSATTTSFTITGSATITGNMVVSGGSGITAVGNTAASGGILFSAANFSGGSKAISNGDTLNVTYSIGV